MWTSCYKMDSVSVAHLMSAESFIWMEEVAFWLIYVQRPRFISKLWSLNRGPADRISSKLFAVDNYHNYNSNAAGLCTLMGFAVRVRSAGQKYGPTGHQRDRADVTEFVTLVRLSSLGQHVGVLALAGYKRRKSALTAGPIVTFNVARRSDVSFYDTSRRSRVTCQQSHWEATCNCISPAVCLSLYYTRKK